MAAAKTMEEKAEVQMVEMEEIGCILEPMAEHGFPLFSKRSAAAAAELVEEIMMELSSPERAAAEHLENMEETEEMGRNPAPEAAVVGNGFPVEATKITPMVVMGMLGVLISECT